MRGGGIIPPPPKKKKHFFGGGDLSQKCFDLNVFDSEVFFSLGCQSHCSNTILIETISKQTFCDTYSECEDCDFCSSNFPRLKVEGKNFVDKTNDNVWIGKGLNWGKNSWDKLYNEIDMTQQLNLLPNSNHIRLVFRWKTDIGFDGYDANEVYIYKKTLFQFFCFLNQ